MSDVRKIALGILLAAFLCLPSLIQAHPSSAAVPPDSLIEAYEIMQRVDRRYTGDDAEWTMQIILRNRHSEERRRDCKLFRKEFRIDGRRQTRQVVVFLSPRNIRSVGMLSFDYKDEALDDDMWLYLPALRKVRRIPASRRGDNFVGTDLTFEDVKQGFAVDDYDYTLQGEETWQDEGASYPVYRIEAVPKTDALKDDLGFHRSDILVRKDIFAMVHQTFYDDKGKALRINEARKFKNIEDIWTAMELSSRDLETDHVTVLEIHQAVYNQELRDDFFHERTLVSERIR